MVPHLLHLKLTASLMLMAACSIPSTASAITRNVPAEYATIQDAINNSYVGDEVVVAPGTYNENVDYGGRAITLRSSSGAAVTVINGDGTNRAVWIGGGLPRAAVIDGFTISTNGMSIEWASPTVRNCVFSHNTRDNGAALRIGNASPLVSDCTFSDNVAQYGQGGAIQAYGGIPCQPIIQDCIFTGNSSPNRSGAMDLNDPGMKVSLANCTFVNNTATGNGGAVGLYNHNPSTFSGCTFMGNTAGNWGGAVLMTDQSSAVFESCNFAGNSVVSTGGDAGGGAAAVFGGSGPVFKVCKFSTNTTLNGHAGALGCRDNGTTLLAEDCEFTGNHASHDGGAVLVWGGPVTATFSRCSFTANMAERSNGGAVHTRDGSTTQLTACAFTGNTANTGGALYDCCGGVLLVTRCTIQDNKASVGAGLRAESQTSVLTVEQSTFTGNTSNDGGAVRIEWMTAPTIRNCRFTGNWSLYGGAIECLSTTNLRVEGCLIADNCARDQGGAIFARDVTGTGHIADCTIANNTAYNGTAGLYLELPCSLVLTNSILSGNHKIDGTPSQLAGNVAPSITYSLVQGGHPGTGNIEADPLFYNAAAGDYRLRTGSPCIDAGSNASVPPTLTTDIEGNPRILDGNHDGVAIVDIGAQEVVDCNGNGVPDYEDILAGTSTDLDANGAPDECDDLFAYNLTLGIEYPSITDAIAAASSGQEILATSLAFASAPTIDFSGKGLFLHSTAGILQAAGGLIQLANSARLATANGKTLTIQGTLRTAGNDNADVFAGVLAVAPGGTLRARSGSSLDITTTGGATLQGMTRIEPSATLTFDGSVSNTGTLTLMSGANFVADSDFANGGTLTGVAAAIYSGPATISGTMDFSGVIWVGSGLTLTSTGRMVAYGEFYTPVANSGRITATADTLLVGNLVNNPSGVIMVQIGTTTLIGSLTNNGTIIGDLQTAPGTAALFVDGDYAAGAGSSLLMADPAWKVSVTGNFDNAINANTRWDMAQATLEFAGLGVQFVEAMSKDVGGDPAGLDRTKAGHFPINVLHIGPNAAVVQVADNRDNDGQGQARPETVYVDTLQVDVGATLSNPTCKVYYRTLVNNGTVTNPANLIRICDDGDADGDNVCDGQDQCPNTIPGATVDADGCPPRVPSDLDRDGDVDADDSVVFEGCATGPAIPRSDTPICQAADLDNDGDVDQSDFGIFQRCYSGEGVPADPACAQ